MSIYSASGEIALTPHGFSKLAYKFPLKLIPAFHRTIIPPMKEKSACAGQNEGETDDPSPEVLGALAYILSFGGGLVGGDEILLTAHVASRCRLTLLTQGNTKVFKQRPMRGIQNRATVQAITCTIEPNASLIMLPGPVQCFAQSAYDQMQRFILKCPTSSNLVLLDSVTSGRASRGEVYHFDRYYSLNEVWSIQTDKRIIRDALLLEKPELTLQKMVYDTYATLILCGPRTRPIIQHFQAAQETVLQLKTLPDLFWSISVLEINVAIVKVAGFSPEAVKLFLQEQTKAGGLEQWLGMDVFKQGWA